MAKTIPSVQGETLSWHVGNERHSITVGAPSWYAWLATATTFAFTSPHGTFTARRERFQRGGSYWKAYRGRSGKLRNAYLGKEEALSLERLNEVATRLANQVNDGPPDAPIGGQPEYSPRPLVAKTSEPNPEAPSDSDSQTPWNSFLATKLSRPPDRGDLLARPRLVTRLDEGLRHKLTLVSAPTGFGKTTLLTHWSVHTTCPVAWVSLSESDSDPVRFWSYVIAALQTVRPDLGQEALSLLRLPQTPSLEVVVTTLINAIAREPEDLALVIDDYHLIKNQETHSALAFLLDHLPPVMHLIIATRADPPLPLARLRGKNQLVTLSEADLSFTSDETAAFLNKIMGLGLSSEDTAALGQRTEGWIVGLHLAALSLRGREDAHGFVKSFTGDNRYIFDYLTEEVLRLQPRSVQTFLLQTSILDRLTGPLCEAVTGNKQSEAMLARLEQDNLFTVLLDDQRQWYRYHHLFAEALQGRLQREHADQIHELHSRACDWYADHGLADEGISHALAAGEFDLAADLIERTAPTMMRRNKMTTMVDWIRALPDELVRARPRLCLLEGWALAHHGQLEAAEARVQDFERSLGVSFDASHGVAVTGLNEVHSENQMALAGLTAVRAAIAGYRGDATAAIALSNQAFSISPVDEAITLSVISNLGLVYLLSGDVDSASRVLTEAGQIGQEDGDSHLVVASLCQLATIQVIEGRLHEAAGTYRQALRIVEEQGTKMISCAGPPYIGMGWLLHEWNNLDAADRYVKRGIELARDDKSNFAALLSYRALARLKRDQGDIDGALGILQQAERIARANGLPHHIASLTADKVRIWLMQGDLKAAIHWAEASGLDAAGEIRYQHEIEQLALARVRLAQGKPAEAVLLLARLLQAAQTAGHQGSVIKISALQALALQAEGNTTQALSTIARALSMAEPNGYVRTFVDLGTPMSALLSKLLGLVLRNHDAETNGVSVAYLRDLLRAFSSRGKLRQSKLSRGEMGQPDIELLRDREIEVLQLIAAGNSVKETAKELVVAESTIRSHIKNIYGKLSAHNRAQAIERAGKLGLLR